MKRVDASYHKQQIEVEYDEAKLTEARIIAQLAATDPDATIDVEEATEIVLPATTRNLVPSHGQPRA